MTEPILIVGAGPTGLTAGFRLDFTRIDSRYHYLFFSSQAETERILRTAVERQGS